MKKYLGQAYDRPSKPTVYHLFEDCPSLAGLDVYEATPKVLTAYNITKVCGRCKKRYGSNNPGAC